MIKAAMLLFIFACTTCYGQLEMHPLLQRRDSVRAHRIHVVILWAAERSQKGKEFIFDRRGRPRREVTYGPAGKVLIVQQYTYRGRRAILRQTYQDGESVQKSVYYLKYDAKGNLVKRSAFNTSGEEVAHLIQYGANGLPVSHYTRYKGWVGDSTVYIYDGALLTGTRTNASERTSFEYDQQGRLIKYTRTYPLIMNAYYGPDWQPMGLNTYTYFYGPDRLPRGTGNAIRDSRISNSCTLTYQFYQ
jgi:YD repeat-containing protein